MSRVEEIERAIEGLNHEEFETISRWIGEKQQAQWDQRLDEDSKTGRLDFLFDEAGEEAHDGQLREWPSKS